MLINLLYLITGLLGFSILVIIRLQFKNNQLVNKYLQLVIAIATIKFTLNGVSPFIEAFPTKTFNFYLDMAFSLVLPSFYLYFKDLALEQQWKRNNLIHLSFSICLLVLFILGENADANYAYTIKKISSICALVFSLIYGYAGFSILRKNVWSKKSELKTVETQNKIIHHWTYILYGCFILFIFRFGFNMFSSSFVYSKSNFYQNTWVSSLVWLVIFFKLLITPQILYGFDFLGKQVEEFKSQNKIMTDIWSIKPLQSVSTEKNLKLLEQIGQNLSLYIQKIETISFNRIYFRNPDSSLEDLAREINIPTSHINYLFKFHCNETFADYKKIFRVQDAIQLIDSGYLDNNTIESIAPKVGFASYSPFFTSFKSITGLSPNEYFKKAKS